MNDEKDDALLGPEGTPRHLHRAPLPEVYRCMLGFESDGVFWRAMPQRPFLPRGLMLWGVPDGATLEQAVIGQELQVLVSASGVPAKFFAMAKSYEELAKRVDEGCEPPAWCTWSRVYPGLEIRLCVRDAMGKALGHADGLQVAMWGDAIR